MIQSNPHSILTPHLFEWLTSGMTVIALRSFVIEQAHSRIHHSPPAFIAKVASFRLHYDVEIYLLNCMPGS